MGKNLVHLMELTQMLGWTWLQLKGGDLPGRKYLTFCMMMLTGQLGTAIDCMMSDRIAWGAVILQAYFFGWTVFGGWKRHKKLRQAELDSSTV